LQEKSYDESGMERALEKQSQFVEEWRVGRPGIGPFERSDLKPIAQNEANSSQTGTEGHRQGPEALTMPPGKGNRANKANSPGCDVRDKWFAGKEL
jgi:hypothetical protein